MSIYCYGADPFDRSPSSTALAKALQEAGFKLSEITHAKSSEEIPSDCYVLSFGSPAFRELTGLEEGLIDNRGQLHSHVVHKDVLVFPTFAPGYLYRNPELIHLWKSDLELFKDFVYFDQGRSI